MGIRAQSIVEAIALDLRDRVYSGKLASGEALTEMSIASLYDVARPTAKAAIEKLTAEGLLLRGRGGVARVPELSFSDIVDIYRTRELLEAAAVRRLAVERRVPVDATRANEEIGAMVGQPHLPAIGPDMRFHLALVEQLGSDRMSRTYSSLAGEVRMCMIQVQEQAPFKVTEMYDQHHQILELIKEGDAESAVSALHDHLHTAIAQMASLLDTSPTPD